MTKFADLCKKMFNIENFYEILNVDKNASEQEIRKAYHKASLAVHPDRVDASEKEVATEKFKVVSHIYSILSDKNKRAVYDETGTYDDDDSAVFKQDFDWIDYWRAIFKPLTKQDYMDYEKKYKGSEAEAEDLRKAYVNGKGCMDFILNSVPFTNCEEEPRLRGIIQKFIDSGDVPAFDEFLHESPRKASRRRKKYEAEAKKAQQIASPLEEDESGEEALRELLMAKQRDRGELMNSFLDKLAEKYGTSSGKKKKPRSKQQSAGKKAKVNENGTVKRKTKTLTESPARKKRRS